MKNEITIYGFTFTLAEFCSKKSAFGIRRANEALERGEKDDEHVSDTIVSELVTKIVKEGEDAPIPPAKWKDTVLDKMPIAEYQKVVESASKVFTADIPDKKKSLKASANS